MTVSDLVLVEVADQVATVTLNRPDARNALNRELRKALPTALRELDERDDVAAIVLTGADPAFCAGLDLKELAGGGDALRETGAVGNGDRHQRGPFPEMRTPVIGAVNGVAITGGFEVALACDYLVASERARFADTHARVGIMPGWGLTVLLPEAIGIRRAKEMSTTGNFLDAETALAWGLVNHIVPHDELLPFA
ncbi:MAG: enoyl-CoA hydratase, partial [Acidimicrobiales bacterium]